MADETRPDDKKKSDDKKPDVKKPESKPAARVCPESERADKAAGELRFRIRASNAGRALGLYVLAPNKDAGIACYLEAEGASIRAAGFDPKTGNGPNDAKLHIQVDELVD